MTTEMHRLYQALEGLVEELDRVWPMLQRCGFDQAWYTEKVEALDDLTMAIAVWLETHAPKGVGTCGTL
jgi:hypothetical protein